LARLIRPPAEGLSGDGNRTRVLRARADRQESRAGLDRLRREAAANLGLVRSAGRVQPGNRKLAVLIVPPAVGRAAHLDRARVLDPDAYGLPVALADVVEHGESANGCRRFRARGEQPDGNSGHGANGKRRR